MRAVTITEPGGPEMLAVSEVADPVCGPDDVLVDVAASALNRADVLQRQGRYPPPDGAPPWPGLECSGVVRAVGDRVEGVRVGAEVCALLAGGGYAERVAVPAGQVLPLPAGVDVVTAAALPEAMCTVWSNLFMTAGLAADEVVLVHGGASGIGTAAVQLARARGARVAVTAGSAPKLERCAELGASILVNYRDEDFVDRVREATGGHGADVVLDIVGAKYLSRNVDVLAADGRLVIIGLQGGRKAELDLAALMTTRASVSGTTLRGRSAARKAEVVAQVRRHVWPLLESGDVVPVVDRTFPMSEAAQAHRDLESGAHVGKILLVN
ncbi:putative PIG3 family NAD(P)H quinone oxidoreductase [Haloactinopolyspora alba]|uniref:Putative PIG3 family NAD(P)H quinone oxidoreductase n=1 Tax=Haloactinopolyspora alba TaxID=648780 RepID=A0A2P8E6V4_9ACTN|nr:NAD(P)H-quinone oxidoreductase [Haloactinopolyspora alba]PSL05211.1 putative PIG3 family NAD(P)H quinone oxidoreductase [Haloactinopolyspora alba]